MILESITIKQQSLPPKENLIRDRGQRIDFYKNHLIAYSSGDWENQNEEDENLPMEKFFYDNTVLIEKSEPLRMEMYYYNKCKKYVLNMVGTRFIFGNGKDHPTLARDECQKLFDKIITWKYS